MKPSEAEYRINKLVNDKINTIKNKDYVKTGVIGARTGLKTYLGDNSETLTQIKSSTESINNMSSDFDDFYSENKPKIDALKLDENSLVFPTKKGTQLRDTHLTALQYANGCIRVAEATNNAVIESTNQINEKNDRDDFVFSSDIVFITKNYSEIILKNVLENIFDADVAAQYLSEIKRKRQNKKTILRTRAIIAQ